VIDERPVARARITLRALVCLVIALAGCVTGGLILWHVVAVKFSMLAGIIGATVFSGSAAWLYVDYIEPLFYRLPPRGPDAL
jgi:hypothetical protein